MVLLSLAFIFAPVNFLLGWYFGLGFLLKAYFIGFAGCMHGLAAAILIAGVIVPPAWLAYWIWEVYNEEVPVQQ